MKKFNRLSALILSFILVCQIALMGCVITDATTFESLYTLKEDIVYAEDAINHEGEPETLKFDAYIPNTVNESTPAIIFFHGGGFVGQAKDADFYVDMCTDVVAQGFAAFSVEYSKYMDGSVYGYLGEEVRALIADQCKLAVGFIKGNADIYNIDPDRIVLCGDSAGAAIAVAVAYDDNGAADAAGVINIWGGMPSFMDVKESGEDNAWGAPIYDYPMPENPAPMSIIHGNADTVAPITTSYKLMEDILEAGGFCELYELEGAGHYDIAYYDEIMSVLLEYAITFTSIYRATFYDGENLLSDLTVRKITVDSYLAEPVAPEKEGYTFSGWYTSKEFIETSLWDFESGKVEQNVNLYAKYEENNIGFGDRLKGDANNADGVTIADAITIFRHLADKALITDEADAWAADVDNKGGITIQDAIYIFRFLADKITLDELQAIGFTIES